MAAIQSLHDKSRAAMLAAAAGDALGWPQERVSRGAQQHAIRESALNIFRGWYRRAGGRFQGHDEPIEAGEYSDDTQLLLCTARSVLRGGNSFKDFAAIELPAFGLYERGAGGATNRAVESWAKGIAPWNHRDSKFVGNYFQAGGNGAAMRILPICIVGSRSDDFGPVRDAIALNAICTHGHPRAVLGAVAYGFVAWSAFRLKQSLEFGGLIRSLEEGFQHWTAFPASFPHDWLSLASHHLSDYETAWTTTAREMVDLLDTATSGINQGALSIEYEVVKHLRAFERDWKGAGTVSAAAAVFLASRYVTTPLEGLREAAFMVGADTDTLASMTGALLGAVCGTEWIAPYLGKLQDRDYITSIADRLGDCRNDRSAEHTPSPGSLPSRLRTFNALGEPEILPDGRVLQILGRSEIAPSRARYSVTLWKCRTDDGQTVYLKKVLRARERQLLEDAPPKPETPDALVLVYGRVDDIHLTPTVDYLRSIGLEVERMDFSKALALRANAPFVLIVVGPTEHARQATTVDQWRSSKRLVAFMPDADDSHSADVSHSVLRGASRAVQLSSTSQLVRVVRDHVRRMITHND